MKDIKNTNDKNKNIKELDINELEEVGEISGGKDMELARSIPMTNYDVPSKTHKPVTNYGIPFRPSRSLHPDDPKSDIKTIKKEEEEKKEG